MMGEIMKTSLRVIGLFLNVGFLATSCGQLKVIVVFIRENS